MSEHEILRREFDAQLSEGDGRTIEACAVPYNVPAVVSDGGPAYEEMFLPGAFSAQLNAANRVKVWLNFEHEQGLRGIVGHGTELAERADGLYGTFRVHENSDGDKALQLVREGLLSGISIEFAALKSRIAGSVTQRLRAHLDKVSLCRNPAYEQSAVLAVREAPTLLADEKLGAIPPRVDSARLERFGIVLPVSAGTLLERAFTEQPWNGAASRYQDSAAYCRACVIDDNPPGKPKVQAMCHLPIQEPNGDVNVNAVRNALQRLPQVNTSQANKDRAQRRLQQLLDQFNQQSGNRAAPQPREEKAVAQLDSMLATARAYIDAEPDAEDQATMRGIVASLDALRAKDVSPGG